jgi:hypothetical protein
MLTAETAVRAWVNSKSGFLIGTGNPLSRGAYLRTQRSPADGCYAVIARSGGSSDMVAEQDSNLSAAVMLFTVYGGTAEAAEIAACALASEIEELTGLPQQCGSTGIRILVADKLNGPSLALTPPDSGELYAFNLSAEFTLAAN